MITFYKLVHYHPINGHPLGSDIGTFSSYDLAESYIDQLIDKVGFNEYPRSSFVITEVVLGEVHWEKGFIKTELGDVEIK